ncbi:MAG TPA: DUF6111 family protein [Stellaceae bacterium]|jgi:hypothetical protein
MREFLTIFLPLALPTVLYLIWLRLAQGGVAWRLVPLLWAAGAGAALLAVVLFTVTVHFGSATNGTYVPPQWRNGLIVPGHIEQAP